MPITGTFQSRNIIAVPSTPGARSVEWLATNLDALSTNPYTSTQLLSDWNAAVLQATVTMPSLSEGQSRAWLAFLLQARQSNVFLYGDPIATSPLGTPTGTALVRGSGQSGFSLNTKNWTPGSTNNLLPGDFIQVGLRLYRNLDVVNADGSGNATLSIWPQIRESPTDGNPLIFNNSKGVFRLSSNELKYSIPESRLYGISFGIIEFLGASLNF